MTGPKLEFASAAWIAEARRILEALVAAHGEPGRRFSVCEVFTDAPAEVAPSGVASWHFRIDGKTVEAGPGTIDGPDVLISADYAATLPNARLVYTPEILAQRRAARSDGARSGGGPKAPRYLVELHNRLAVLTA
jgi:hypothetical protein